MADRTILERKSAENGAEKRTANRPFSSDTYESNRCQVDQPTHQASKKGRNEKALAECRVPFQAHNEESHTALLQRHAGRVDAQSHESLETANQHISAPAAVAREANSGRKNDNASTAAQSALRQHQAYGFSLYGSVPGMIPGMHYQTSLRPSIMPHPSMPIPSGQSVKEKALRPMQKSAQHSAMAIGTAVAEAAKIATTRERTSTVAQPVVREQSLNSSKGTNGQSTMSSGKAPAEARNIRANSEKTSVLYTAAQSALRQHQSYGSSLYGSVPGMIPSMQYQIPLRPSIMPHPSMPIPSPYLGVPNPYYASPTSPYVMQYPPGVSTLWPYGPSLYPTPGFANRPMHHSPAAQVPTMDQGLDLTKPPKDQAYLSEKQRLDLTKVPKDQAYLNDRQGLDITKLPKDQACLNDKQSKILRIHFNDNYFPSDEEYYAMSVQIGHPVQLIKMWFDWERSRHITNVSKNLPLASSINVKEYIRSGKLEPASDDTVDTRSRVERAQKHRATESAVNAQIGPHAAKKPRTLTGDPGSAPEATSTNKEPTNQIQTQQNPAAPEYFQSKGEIEGTIRTAPLEWEMPGKKIDTSVRYMPQDYFTNGSNIYSSENRWNKRRKEILNDPNFDTNKYSIAEDTVHNLADILHIPENVVKDWCKRLKDSQAVKEPYALDALRPSLRWLYVPGPIKMSDTRKFYFCEYCSLGGARRYKLRYFIIHQYHFFQTNKCEEEAGLLYQWLDGRFNPRYGSGATPALNVQLKPESNSNPERRTNYNMQHIPEAAQLLDNPLKAKSRDLVVNNVSKNPELLENPLKTTSQDLVVNNVSKNPELLENPSKTTSQDLVVNNISKNPELLENPLKTTSQDLVVNNISKNPELLENPLTTKPKDPVVSSTLESYITSIPVGTVTFRSDETIVEPTIIKPITPKTESVSSKLEPIPPKLEPISTKPEPTP